MSYAPLVPLRAGARAVLESPLKSLREGVYDVGRPSIGLDAMPAHAANESACAALDGADAGPSSSSRPALQAAGAARTPAQPPQQQQDPAATPAPTLLATAPIRAQYKGPQQQQPQQQRHPPMSLFSPAAQKQGGLPGAAPTAGTPSSQRCALHTHACMYACVHTFRAPCCQCCVQALSCEAQVATLVRQCTCRAPA